MLMLMLFITSTIGQDSDDYCKVCKEVKGKWVRCINGVIKEDIPCLCSQQEQAASCEAK